MKIRLFDGTEHFGDGCRCTVAAAGQPARHFLKAVVPHGRHHGLALPLKIGGGIARGAAEGLKQGLALLHGPIALGEALKHLGHPNGEEAFGAKALLMA